MRKSGKKIEKLFVKLEEKRKPLNKKKAKTRQSLSERNFLFLSVYTSRVNEKHVPGQPGGVRDFGAPAHVICNLLRVFSEILAPSLRQPLSLFDAKSR